MSDYYFDEIMKNARGSFGCRDDGWDQLQRLEYEARQRRLYELDDGQEESRPAAKKPFILHDRKPKRRVKR